MPLPALVPAAGGLITKGVVAAKAAMVAKGAAIGAAGVAAGAAAAKTASSAAKAASGAASAKASSNSAKAASGSASSKEVSGFKAFWRFLTKNSDKVGRGVAVGSSVLSHSSFETKNKKVTFEGKSSARLGGYAFNVPSIQVSNLEKPSGKYHSKSNQYYSPKSSNNNFYRSYNSKSSYSNSANSRSGSKYNKKNVAYKRRSW